VRRCGDTACRPPVSAGQSWCRRGDLNPHALAGTRPSTLIPSPISRTYVRVRPKKPQVTSSSPGQERTSADGRPGRFGRKPVEDQLGAAPSASTRS
jgi:hypothetical protein